MPGEVGRLILLIVVVNLITREALERLSLSQVLESVDRRENIVLILLAAQEVGRCVSLFVMADWDRAQCIQAVFGARMCRE